jgi:hypothetical protein
MLAQCQKLAKTGTLLIAAAGLFACVPAARSATLTFRFSASIASVIDTNGGAGFPHGVQVGDTMKGLFQLEVDLVDPQGTQNGALQLFVSTHELQVQPFSASVANDDFPNAVPRAGQIANPASIIVGDVAPGSSDRILLTCPSSDHFCGVVPGAAEISFRPRVALVNADTLLQDTSLPSDPSIWNAFTFREMSLTFWNSETGGTTYIGADVGGFALVPEPAGLIVAQSGVTLWLVLLGLRWKWKRPLMQHHWEDAGVK